MTTLICDFQSIVGKKIKGYATLTAGQTRPAYDAPSVIVHDPIEKEVVQGRAVFENVNPGDAVITVDWEDQSSTIRFVVPNSEEDIYLSDCLTGDYFTPEEIDLLRWGIKEQISGARELIESTAGDGMDGITGSIADFFTRAANTVRETEEAADRAETALAGIDTKIQHIEEFVPLAQQTSESLQTLADKVSTEEGKLRTALETMAQLQEDSATALQAANQAKTETENLSTEYYANKSVVRADIEALQQNISSAANSTAQLEQYVNLANQQANTKLENLSTAQQEAADAYADSVDAFRNVESQMQTIGNQYADAVDRVGEAIHNYDQLNEALQNLQVGGRNLVLNSARSLTSTEYLLGIYTMAEIWEKGATYTASIKGVFQDELGNKPGIWAAGTATRVAVLEKNPTTGIYQATFVVPTGLVEQRPLEMRIYDVRPNADAPYGSSVEWVKIERGNKATDWTPAPEDTTSMVNQLPITNPNLFDGMTFFNNTEVPYQAVTALPFEDKIYPGETLTFSIKGTLPAGRTGWAIAEYPAVVDTNNFFKRFIPKNTSGDIHTITFEYEPESGAPAEALFIMAAKDQAEFDAKPGVATVDWVKLERGSKATAWEAPRRYAQRKLDEAQNAALAAQAVINAKQDAWNKAASDAIRSLQAAEEIRKNSVSLIQNDPQTGNPPWADYMKMTKRTFSNPPGSLGPNYVYNSASEAPGRTGPDYLVDPNITYRYSLWIRASKANSKIFIELRDQNGGHAIETSTGGGEGQYILTDYLVPTSWTKVEGELNLKSTTTSVYLARWYPNHANGTVRDADILVADFKIVPYIPPKPVVEDIQNKAIEDAENFQREQKLWNTFQEDINQFVIETQNKQSEMVMKSMVMNLNSTQASFTDPENYFRVYNNNDNIDIDALTTNGAWVGRAILTLVFGTQHETAMIEFNVPDGVYRRRVRSTQTRTNRKMARLDWWVYKKIQKDDVTTEASAVAILGAQIRTTHTFVTKVAGEHVIEFELDWVNAARGGREYAIRIKRGSTILKEIVQTNIGPTWPWEDGRRRQKITWRGDLPKSATITFEVSTRNTAAGHSWSTDQLRIENVQRKAIWMQEQT